MVATISVLSGSASGIAKYFSAGAATDYYAAERQGLWWGDAVESLKLPAKVTSHDLQHVLLGMTLGGTKLIKERGVSPKKAKERSDCGTSVPRSLPVAGGAPAADSSAPRDKVVAIRSSTRCPGYDVTFSSPKSVSALWAVGDEAMRHMIESAVMSAARESLMTLRETVPLARRGRGGTEQIFAEWAAAMFLHTINRDQEPQLHIHSVMPNLCCGVDGRWCAINSRLLHQWIPALGRVFRCQLAAELTTRMGLALYRPQRPDGSLESWFEIKGVPTALMDDWSSRRKAIENSVNERGELIDLRSAKAREVANLATRKSKSVQQDMDSLLTDWRQHAQSHGFDNTAAKDLLGTRQPTVATEQYPTAFQAALQKLSIQHAHFSARDVVQQVCEDMQHLGMPARSLVRRIVRDLEQSPDVVRLQSSSQERRYATQETWQREEKLLNDVRGLKEQPGASLSEKKAEKAINRDKELSAEQREAARHLLCETGSIRVLSGVAGAGKSRTLDVVRDGFERAGYRVIGGALAGAAKEELARQAHIDSRTVASYLHHLEKSTGEKLRDRVVHDIRQLGRALLHKPTYAPTKVTMDKNTVLILDEAAMLDTSTLERLIHHVRKANATLILAGDWKQLPPILAGSPMERIAKEVGAARLQDNRRQMDPEDRKAVEQLRKGDVAEALQNYAKRDRVIIGGGQRDTLEKLTTTWAEQGGARRPADHMIFTQTRAEAHEVNRLCQQHVLKSFRAVPILSVTHGEDKFHIGDRILFHQSFRSQGVENGYRGTVIAVNPILKQIKVKLDHEPSKEAKARGVSRFVTVPLRSLPEDAVTLGYAATTHKLQGQTVQHAYLLMGSDMTSREMAYVQATRAKHSTRIFVDEQHAGPELKDLITTVEKSKAKDLAHDLAIVQSSPPSTSQQVSHTYENSLRPGLGR